MLFFPSAKADGNVKQLSEEASKEFFGFLLS